MTLKDVFSRLHDIDQTAQALIRDAGFSFDTGSVENVPFAPDDPDTRIIRKEEGMATDKDMRRYERPYINEVWYSDTCHGPWLTTP